MTATTLVNVQTPLGWGLVFCSWQMRVKIQKNHMRDMNKQEIVSFYLVKENLVGAVSLWILFSQDVFFLIVSLGVNNVRHFKGPFRPKLCFPRFFTWMFELCWSTRRLLSNSSAEVSLCSHYVFYVLQLTQVWCGNWKPSGYIQWGRTSQWRTNRASS